MRKYSSEMWLYSLIAVAVVAVVGYFLYLDFTGAGRERTAPAEPQAEAHILTCTAPDGSVFYTDAASCEDADLDNRLTVVAAQTPADIAGMGRDCLSAGGRVRAQQFLAACQAEFQQALKIEPRLARAEDPVASRYAREYCDLIAQGVSNGCMATSHQFCYLRVCQLLLERGQENMGSE